MAETLQLSEAQARTEWRDAMQAATLIRVKRSENDQAATASEALVSSGALDLLVDGSRICRRFDYDAHPGPLQRANTEGFRIAVTSHADAEGDQVLGNHPTACLAFFEESK